jgi:dihydropteroate synthase
MNSAPRISPENHPRPHRRPSSLKLKGGAVIRFRAVMGVLNVTPDSFSDGGLYLDPERAVAHALEMEAAGADIIDVGGESSRPVGAREIPLEEEIARVGPVIERLGKTLRVPISIDTRRAEVARMALEAGAAIINDISALRADRAMAPLVAKAECALVLMHMRGGPENHAKLTRYRDVVAEVVSFLEERVRFARAAGIAASRIVLDPGIGFAKNARHNLQLIAALPRICALGYPVLVGCSRKRFVRSIAGAGEPEMTFGTAAADAIAVANGASIVRVHDVAASRAAVAMAAAIVSGKVQAT